ncbi:MAG TPA: polysaccharide deacetylase family protein [Solirubrobacteraceae bacterium]|jgi:peptidoglycan/xylan/chitin deacetylase (PgdA/CDA1 family)|nr:polysaccharide deacetylase family protein [Solirubrobacteraceae bacterium]
MSRRWNWDFEDEPRRARKVPPLPLQQLEPSPGARFRRRRLGATLVFAALVIALVVVLLSSLGSGGASSAGTHRHAPAVAARSATPPSDTLETDNKAITSTLAYTPFVRAGGDDGRDIALTFDDGPGPYTPEVLDVLEREHVPATFFVIGEELRYFSASTAREIRDGFVIGDHTETHPMLAQMTAHEQHEELFEQAARIELLGAPRPRLFRPPYGSFNTTTFHLLHQMHMLMVLWSVDTGDYTLPGVGVIVQRALEGAKPGAIILMHDAGGDRSETVAALPTIIRALRQRGYRLVTVPQLLHDDPPPAGQPLPTNLSGG